MRSRRRTRSGSGGPSWAVLAGVGAVVMRKRPLASPNAARASRQDAGIEQKTPGSIASGRLEDRIKCGRRTKYLSAGLGRDFNPKTSGIPKIAAVLFVS